MAKTLEEQLSEARADLQAWLDRFERYDGNNPDKFRSDIDAARRHLQRIERAMRERGERPASSV